MNLLVVVYEDSDLLVINKPSGLLTHPRNKDDNRESVISWLKENRPAVLNIGDRERPGIVHRIDKETSGLLMIAKTPIAYEYYKKAFHDRQIQKTYLALVYGTVKNAHGTIDAPLFKFGTRQSMKPSRNKELTERTAQTDYQVLKRFSLLAMHYTLLEVQPKTGRTHQIRIHLRSIGHPIVCDPIYAEKSRLCPAELGRLFLHAKKLSFTDSHGKAITLEADMPTELESFVASLAEIK